MSYRLTYQRAFLRVCGPTPAALARDDARRRRCWCHACVVSKASVADHILAISGYTSSFLLNADLIGRNYSFSGVCGTTIDQRTSGISGQIATTDSSINSVISSSTICCTDRQ